MQKSVQGSFLTNYTHVVYVIHIWNKHYVLLCDYLRLKICKTHFSKILDHAKQSNEPLNLVYFFHTTVDRRMGTSWLPVFKITL